MSNEEKFPELIVQMKGTNGIEIKAIPGESFNCIEYTLKADRPQTILYQPWIQFESEAQRQWRAKWATEIARRATMFESMVSKIKDLESNLELHRNECQKLYKQQNAYFEVWRQDRAKHGLPEDFSDIPKEVWTNIDAIRGD